MKRFAFVLIVMAMAGLWLPIQAHADDTYTVSVGYADNLRPDAPSAFFPNPWAGSPNVALFSGNATNVDAGAVMITNTGASNITLNALTITLPQAGGFTLWGSSFPFVLAPGMEAIFTQTTPYNLDTSDFPIVPADISNNCSVGALASSSVCVSNAPIVTVTTGISGALAYTDSGHVLDTGGFDANCCLPLGNESLNWRLIGTTGVDNPGGTSVPEPASLLLLGSGLAGLAAWRIRRNK